VFPLGSSGGESGCVAGGEVGWGLGSQFVPLGTGLGGTGMRVAFPG